MAIVGTDRRRTRSARSYPSLRSRRTTKSDGCARAIADAARDTAATFDKWLRNTIETQPYTTAIVALGIWMAVGTDASATLVVNIFGNCAPPQLPSGGVLFLRQTTI